MESDKPDNKDVHLSKVIINLEGVGKGGGGLFIPASNINREKEIVTLFVFVTVCT